MKSIMEEASSVAKAIEKGWQRAGKPQEFTVKVFEEPQKNFIGLTRAGFSAAGPVSPKFLRRFFKSGCFLLAQPGQQRGNRDQRQHGGDQNRPRCYRSFTIV